MNPEQPIPAEQKTTAQQLIAADIQPLIEQLEVGNSDPRSRNMGAQLSS
jgi:hypothetical protein